MLLKVGGAMMLSAVALALVVAAVVALSGPAEEETTSQQAASVEPVSSEAAEPEKREFDPGEKLQIDDEEPAASEEKGAPGRPERREEEAQKKTTTLPVALDASASPWPAPSTQEVAAAGEPRYYPRRQDGVLTLTVDAIGLHDVPVMNEPPKRRWTRA